MSIEATIILNGRDKLTLATETRGSGSPSLLSLTISRAGRDSEGERDLAIIYANRTETLALAAALKEVGSKLKK